MLFDAYSDTSHTDNGLALARFIGKPSIDLKLTIDLSTDKTHEGDIVVISGRLTYKDGTPIPDALIKIFEDDSITELTNPPDDFITKAKTNKEGYYEVEWVAKNTDGWLHKKVDLYSKFEGPPSYIESDTVHIQIEPKAVEHKMETIEVKEECITEIKGENFELALYTLPSEGELEVNIYKDAYIETQALGESYTGIGLSVNLTELSVKSATIKVYYTDEEIKEFDEASLKLYKWDESLGEWIELSGGVNPEENYVWAEVTSFSNFAVFGNKKPAAYFDFSPTEPNVNDAVMFTSLSYDPDGTIVKYIWDFGDGMSETTTVPTVTHAYSSEGIYTVTLTVIDNDGASTTVSKSIEVLAPTPQEPPFTWLMQLWQALLNVSGTASTGELDASWELVDYSDNDIGYGFAEVSISEDGKTVTVTVDNAYPGYEVDIDLNIVNTGTIAAKIGNITVNKDDCLEITHPQIEGEIIDVGQKISVPVNVRVSDLANEKNSYSFSLTFEVKQFNK